MNTSFDFSMINSSNTQIYVKPVIYIQSDEIFSMSKVYLRWTIQSFKNDTMIISLNFD